MTRRSLFRTLTACVVASSMEVFGCRAVIGLDPSFNKFSGDLMKSEWITLPYYFESQMPRVIDILKMHANGEPLPHGMGFNYHSVGGTERPFHAIPDRSEPS